MVHSISRVVAVLLMALAAATGAGAAHGEEVSFTDTTSDVHTIYSDNSTRLYGAQVNTDLTSVHIDHRNRRLKATFAFADLAQIGEEFHQHLYVLTSDDRRFIVRVTASPNDWAGQPELGKWRSGSPSRPWRGLECPSMRREINYDANTVFVSLGTDCLGKPRWVRVAADSWSRSTGPDVYVDDARRASVPIEVDLSRKLRRG